MQQVKRRSYYLYPFYYWEKDQSSKDYDDFYAAFYVSKLHNDVIYVLR